MEKLTVFPIEKYEAICYHEFTEALLNFYTRGFYFMDNKYTISEIARMSLLSEKTIRNYMQLGILAGEKISGT